MRKCGPRKRSTTAKGGVHTLAWNPIPQHLSGGTIVVEGRAATRGTAQEPPRVPPPGDGEGNRQGEAPGAGAGGPPPPDGGSGRGGGSSLDNDSDGDDDADDMEEDPEDPSDRQAGRTYMPRTEGGKAMAKMLRKFCRLTKADKMAFVIYFGVYSENRLAEFQEAHW